MSELDLAVSIALGIGLAAAVGFRVFLPLLVMSIAAYTGHLTLGAEFPVARQPHGSRHARVATVAEVLAYYIPGVDNLLDTIATPTALVAGTVAAAAVMADVPPLIKWTTAVIAGGGAAGLTQGVTALLRAKSTAFTGGLGNSAVATGELGGARSYLFWRFSCLLAALALVVLFCVLRCDLFADYSPPAA